MTDMATLDMPRRAPYEGLALILKLHWPVYVFGGGVALLAAVLGKILDLNPLLSGSIWAGAAFALLWLGVSLVASHYIYDRSALFEWAWLPKILPRYPRRWLNLHAGLDDASEAMHVLFPSAQGQTLDVYTPVEMSEPSILRLRNLRRKNREGQARRFPELPCETASRDVAMLFMMAHEVRTVETRIKFFREVHRVLEAGGTLVMIEHVRNAWNFAAFGPEYWHFYPDAEWKRVLSEAGFALKAEEALTPFLKVYVWEKTR